MATASSPQETRGGYTHVRANSAGDEAEMEESYVEKPLQRNWLSPRSHTGRKAAAMLLALVAGVALAVATGSLLGAKRAQQQHLHIVLPTGVEMKAEHHGTWEPDFPSQCAKLEVDVEYEDEDGAWGVNYDHIPTPEMCCAMCQGVPQCQAFTWVKDAGLDGCPSQCWLKSGGSSKPKPKKGVVSGVPPLRRSLPPTPSGVNGPGGKLYCFSLFVPTSYEPGMLKWQYEHQASIFACDGYGVYSNRQVEIVPGLKSVIVDSDLKCEYGGDSGTALNAWIFIAVWKAVIDDGTYKQHDWVVKVDPDAVFFPDRLGKLLAKYPEKQGYINNCKYGMHGPIEVVSSAGFDLFAADYKRSWDGKAPKKCVSMDFGLWGEDMFLDQCLKTVLKVRPRPLEPSLMCEAHCDCPAWYWCQNGTDRVSYHPFKSPEAYAVCMGNALGGKPGASFDEYAVDTPKHFKMGPPPKPKKGEKKPPADEDEDEDEDEEDAAPVAAGECKDAVTESGSTASGLAACAKDVRWAKNSGINEHPEWYEGTGLSSSSPLVDFQQFLFNKGKAKCPKPCTKSSIAGSSSEEDDDDADSKSPSPPPPPAAGASSKPAPAFGPKAQTFYMYRAQSEASYPMENINTADLAGVMWYLHHEVVSNTPRKYHIDRIKRFKVTVKNTWEFYNTHKRQFGAFMAYDAARCSTPICKKVYKQYGFIVGCQVCDVKVAKYLAKSQTNWNCKKGADECRAPLWYSLPGPCPSKGMSNEEINPNKVGLDVNKFKTPECVKAMPGGHCDKATGAPDCTYSYEEAGEIMLDDLVGISNYNEFWNASYTKCANKVARGELPHDTHCEHKKEYVTETDKGVGTTFWDGIHDEDKCTARMEAVRKLFKSKFPQFPLSLEEPPCEFDMYYDGEFEWKVNHTGAEHSDYWANQLTE